MKKKALLPGVWAVLEINNVQVSLMSDHDRCCLEAAYLISRCWVRGDAANRAFSAQAFGRVVAQMQFYNWEIAYHVVYLWSSLSHRRELWAEAQLPGPCITKVSGDLACM